MEQVTKVWSLFAKVVYLFSVKFMNFKAPFSHHFNFVSVQKMLHYLGPLFLHNFVNLTKKYFEGSKVEDLKNRLAVVADTFNKDLTDLSIILWNAYAGVSNTVHLLHDWFNAAHNFSLHNVLGKQPHALLLFSNIFEQDCDAFNTFLLVGFDSILHL